MQQMGGAHCKNTKNSFNSSIIHISTSLNIFSSIFSILGLLLKRYFYSCPNIYLIAVV